MNLNHQELNCFEVKIGLVAFLLAAMVGTVLNMAYGELLEKKGEFYCYDETTTTKQEVLDAIKHDWVSQVMELENKFFTSFIEDGYREQAQTGCQNMIAQGSIDNEDYHDEPIVLEGTLTLEFDWDD